MSLKTASGAVAAANGFGDVRHDPDLVTPWLAALQFCLAAGGHLGSRLAVIGQQAVAQSPR